ncbi:MAG: VOC family protein [Phycisphaerae bacterium]
MVECAFFGGGARFHHVGLVVKSIRAVNPSCEIVVEETQRVSLAFTRFHDIAIELLEPLGEDSPIARSLREGIKLHHLCFEVPDLDATLEQCRKAGFHRLGKPFCAPVFENDRAVWVFSKHYGLFELIERSREDEAERA